MFPILNVKLVGGLGNQLFQYAHARVLTKNKGNILLDISSYENDYLGRVNSLINYDVKVKIVNNIILDKIFKDGTKLNKVVTRLKIFSNIKEQGFFIHENLENRLALLTRMEGYWQSAEYFQDIRNILLKEFKPKKKPELPYFVSENTVAVHVRRTDYLTNTRYGFIGKEYYIQAMDIIQQKLGQPLFIFFSDDIPWCKSEFNSDNILYFEDNLWDKDYLQLYLMSKCKHHIIANSSFSWWGAWLNEFEEKIVIRPKNPFRDSSIFHEKYYPNSWIAV